MFVLYFVLRLIGLLEIYVANLWFGVLVGLCGLSLGWDCFLHSCGCGLLLGFDCLFVGCT